MLKSNISTHLVSTAYSSHPHFPSLHFSCIEWHWGSIDLMRYILLVHSHITSGLVFTSHHGVRRASRNILVGTVPSFLIEASGWVLRYTIPKWCRYGKNEVEIHGAIAGLGKTFPITKMKRYSQRIQFTLILGKTNPPIAGIYWIIQGMQL